MTRHIAGYGPFRLDARFAFTNLKAHGSGKNRGLQFCVEAARGKACVIDVGAHVGYVTLPLSTVVADGGEVHSFEPSDVNRDLLRRHIALNRIGNVQVSGNLVGAEDRDDVTFYLPDGESPLGSTAPRFDDDAHSQTSRQQTSLDSYCAAHNLRPDVIKIDVEGAEFNVIQGARRTLADCRPILFLSLHRKELIMLGSSIEEVCQLMADIGYTICDMDGTPAKRIGTDEYLCRPADVT